MKAGRVGSKTDSQQGSRRDQAIMAANIVTKARVPVFVASPAVLPAAAVPFLVPLTAVVTVLVMVSVTDALLPADNQTHIAMTSTSC
jgi:hypothetical protein